MTASRTRLAPDDVFRHPHEWTTITRDAAQGGGRSAHVVVTSGRHAEWFDPASPLFRRPGVAVSYHRYVGVRAPRTGGGTTVPVSQPEPAAAPEAAPETARHWIEFRFRDLADRPLAGIRYRIDLPSRQQVKGKLDQRGTVRHEPQPQGRGTVQLADVEEARWSAGLVEAHDPVDLSIRATGLDAGEAVRFEIFRLYRERPEDVVATLEGTLDEAGRATATWTPETIEVPDDRFVFKATVGGARRTSDPVAVCRHPVSAAWSEDLASDGEAVGLRAHLRGVRDGEAATITIVEKRWREAQDREVQQLQGRVSGGGVDASWTVPASAEPPARGDSGRRDFYYTVAAGGLHCMSGLLAVFPRETSA